MDHFRSKITSSAQSFRISLQILKRKEKESFPLFSKSPTKKNIYLSPSIAKRCRSATGKIILEDLFSSVLSQFKKYHPSEDLKFNNLGIAQSLKLRILMEKKSSQFLSS